MPVNVRALFSHSQSFGPFFASVCCRSASSKTFSYTAAVSPGGACAAAAPFFPPVLGAEELALAPPCPLQGTVSAAVSQSAEEHIPVSARFVLHVSVSQKQVLGPCHGEDL